MITDVCLIMLSLMLLLCKGDPDVLANDIIENLEARIESFKEIYSIVEQ